jgi:hypothetical protein
MSSRRAAAVGALGLPSHATTESVRDTRVYSRGAELGLGSERSVIGMSGTVGRQGLVADVVEGRGRRGRGHDGRLVGIPCRSVRRRGPVLRILILFGLARVLAPKLYKDGVSNAPRGYNQGQLTTLAPKRFIFEDNSFSSVGRREAPSSTLLRTEAHCRWAGCSGTGEGSDCRLDSRPHAKRSPLGELVELRC